MDGQDRLSVARVDSLPRREQAIAVLRSVYRDEKGWVPEADRLLPAEDLGRTGVAWFLAVDGSTPLGVVRLLFDLPLELYRAYGLKFLSSDLDMDSLLREYRIVEVGRFAVLPERRGDFLVAAHLMRAVARETLERRYTHLVTDVFEDDPNSPYEFHSRVLGFQPVATHDHGEVAVRGRRITMLLDIRRAYERLRSRRNWMFRFITEGWDDAGGVARLVAEA
ncbi:MAG TPA: hypothetical protein VMT19_06380 [Thermoanaerobaculaceae bacterium]|nr:hypothetical protein [Thermoanaerobaculaceae bacterium]